MTQPGPGSLRYRGRDMSEESSGWFRSTEPKRIALSGLLTVLVVLSIGSFYAVVLGLERVGTRLPAQVHGQLLSAHGLLMAFLVVVPAIPMALGSFVLPGMLGADRPAFPRIQRAALWVFWLGAALALFGVISENGRGGWTFTEAHNAKATGVGMLVAMGGVLLVSISAMLNGIDAIASIHGVRRRGLTFDRLPLFVWAEYAASAVAVFAPAPLALGFFTALAERYLHIGALDPALGGDPRLMLHLFWAFAHPTLFASVLWSLGVGSELFAVHANRRLYGHAIMPALFFALAMLSFFQWGTHLSGAGVSEKFSVTSSLVALIACAPIAIVLGNWVLTLRGGSITLKAPMLHALALLVNLSIWLSSSVVLDVLGLGDALRGTPFEVSSLHYGLVGGTLTAFLAGLFHWWPSLTGRTYDEGWARIGAITTFVGVNVTFLGQLATAHSAPVWVSRVSTLGSLVLVTGGTISTMVLLASFRAAPDAPRNPWGAKTLEWKS